MSAKVTIYTIERHVEESSSREMFKLFENFNDYERRLMQAKLLRMNRNAKGLPPLALQCYGISL